MRRCKNLIQKLLGEAELQLKGSYPLSVRRTAGLPRIKNILIRYNNRAVAEIPLLVISQLNRESRVWFEHMDIT
jgi:hypothetical protein